MARQIEAKLKLDVSDAKKSAQELANELKKILTIKSTDVGFKSLATDARKASNELDNLRRSEIDAEKAIEKLKIAREDVSKANARAEKITKDLMMATRELSKEENRIAAAQKAVSLASSEIAQREARVAIARANVEKATVAVRAAERALKNEREKAVSNQTMLEAAENRLAKARADLTTANQRVIQNQSQLTAAQTKGEIAAQRLANAKSNLGAKTQQLGLNYRKAIAPLFAFNNAMFAVEHAVRTLRQVYDEFIGTAIEFESGFAGVTKTVDGVVERTRDGSFAITQFGASMRREFLALSREIPVSIDKLLKIGELGGQFNISPDALVAFTEIVAKLEATTDITSENAEEFAQLINILNIAEEDFGSLAAAIVDLGNNSATTESKIIRFARRMGAAAELVGFTTGEVIGLSAGFASLGIGAESSASAIQRTLLTIETAVIEGGDALADFAAVTDMTASEFAALWESDPAEGFIVFLEGLRNAGDESIAALGALDLSTIRVLRTLLAGASAADTIRAAVERGRKATEEATAANEEAEKRFATTASALDILRNSWDEYKIAIADTSWVETAAGAITEYIRSLTDASVATNRLLKITKDVGGLGSGFGTVTDEYKELAALLNQRGLSGSPVVLPSGFRKEDVEEANNLLLIWEQMTEIGLDLTVDSVNGQMERFLDISERVKDFTIEDFLGELRLEKATADLNEFVEGMSRFARTAEQVESLDILRGMSGEELLSVAEALSSGQLDLRDLMDPSVVNAFVSSLREGTGVATDFTAEQQAMADAIAQSANSMLTLVESLNVNKSALDDISVAFIKAAIEAGATDREVLSLATSMGILVGEEAELLSKTLQLDAFQARMIANVRAGSISFDQASAAVIQYAKSLGLATEQVDALSKTTQSSFLSFMGDDTGGSSGGGSVSSQPTIGIEFSKNFANALKSVKDEGFDLEGQVDSLTMSLFDLAEAGGASATELVLLAGATGLLDEEQLQLALRMATAQEGVERLAEAYLNGEITAEQAAQGVGLLQSQLAEGMDIDLSGIGISLANLDDKVKSVGGSAGAASDQMKTWRDTLFQTAADGELSYQQLLDVIRATGTEVDFATTAIQDAMSRLATRSVLEIAAGLDPDEAVRMIENIEQRLSGIGDAEGVALALDIIFNESSLEAAKEALANALSGSKVVGGGLEELSRKLGIEAETEQLESDIGEVVENPWEVSLEADTESLVDSINAALARKWTIQISADITGGGMFNMPTAPGGSTTTVDQSSSTTTNNYYGAGPPNVPGSSKYKPPIQ